MKHLFAVLIFSLLIPTTLSAIELENRLPASVWEIELRVRSTPAYDRTYNGYGKETPLQQLVLWDRDWRDALEGKLQREEQLLEFKIAYGWTEKWMLEVDIPLVQKKQTSSLKLTADNETQQEILDVLASESLSGLGDISLKIAKDLSAGTTWYNRGGFTVRLPTGNSGTPRGVSAHAIGEGHGAVGAFLHLTWYPLIPGLRNGFRFEGSNELIGKRKTLEGKEGYYSAGHRADFYYNWSIERQNLFVGSELHYFQQAESSLPVGKSNASFLKEINFEFGYGNLSDLEQGPLFAPWQIRLGYTRPLAGQNVPIAPRWELSALFFF